MSSVRRIYVEKKEPYAIKAQELAAEIKGYLGIKTINNVRILVRYDVENITTDTYQKAIGTVFSEPPVDLYYEEEFEYTNEKIFSVEYLPGQFDQRADSAQQCIRLLNDKEDPIIRTALTYLLDGELSPEQFLTIKNHCINPVDSRETNLEKPQTLLLEQVEPEAVAEMEGFLEHDKKQLNQLYNSLNLAMTEQDFLHIQNYFREEEKRNPTMTEIRVLDTYWSDHCRHTTFSTELKNIHFEAGLYHEPLTRTYADYRHTHDTILAGRSDQYTCLMDLALMAMRKLKQDGKLKGVEESEEINACSIIVPAVIDGKKEEWLVNFKNETHNHPTEIEPFGGAATCLGGAIRDPLSGRTYVYQAMRVTGAADPTQSLGNTLSGKLPQKKLVQGAAQGYSSYGNQIGLATGLVKEIYHPGYVAKRMEIGAVIGAAPRKNVIRESCNPGDIIILLGGRTGRDGIGGATGSSKVHTEASIETCGAEVQKGNPPTERKIQRLFCREEVSRLIKKCNDFGAGGVSVAIGELADGLRIELDKVPKKYAGLDGTEIAISESQERMAVVVDPSDVEQFLAFAASENLEAVPAAVVTAEPRLVMVWQEQEIVNISRAFLNTNGAHQETDVYVEMPDPAANCLGKITTEKVAEHVAGGDLKAAWLATLADLNVCSQKGLVERFDSSIGAGSVLMPYGGKYQLTETQAMVAKLPLQQDNTDTVTMMSYGFDPQVSSFSPYHGAVYAVTESIAKIVAAGGDPHGIYFTFQEYFRRMSADPRRWSQPVTALLGAYQAQIGYGLASIGGKDSMSGTFQEIDVPPTLVSFAVDVANRTDIISPELKRAGNWLVVFEIEKDEFDLPNYQQVMLLYTKIHQLIQQKIIFSAYAVDAKGIAAAISKMAFGNKLGVLIAEDITKEELFTAGLGNLIVEVSPEQYHQLEEIMAANEQRNVYRKVAQVQNDAKICYGTMEISIAEAIAHWSRPLEAVFPTQAAKQTETLATQIWTGKSIAICHQKAARPTVFIPVLPGTNCEYDSARAFESAGANVITKVFCNTKAGDIEESVQAFVAAIDQAQILMFPGGFSAGDEPEGSAKFFAAVFRNERIAEAVNRLLKERDGLALGICNGFQALLKLGLLPFGEITPQTKDAPTLTYNTIGRHISKMVATKVISKKSPWLAQAELGKVYVNPASHGEGRFVAPQSWLQQLFENGQVATQYVDDTGTATMDESWNVNGSYQAIEGITSPDGRILGKMAHAERRGKSVAINIWGDQNIKLFESGISYFQ